MSTSDAIWFIGECGAAWFFGFNVGYQWASVKRALYAASE